MEKIKQAIEDLKLGRPVIISDNEKRENESDIAVHASFATPAIIKKLRKEAGGMICLVIDEQTAKLLGLKYFTSFLRDLSFPYNRLAIDRTPYGDEPAFTIYINSRKCYSGISDIDRSTTITEFEKLISQKNKTTDIKEEFVKNFYSPGHVPLLIAKDLARRKGHSEYSISLAKLANLSPAMVICEMLSDNFYPMRKKEIEEYAKKNNIINLKEEDFQNI